MHECSDQAAGSWREASLWRRNCAATFRHSQWVASLSGVFTDRIEKIEIGCNSKVVIFIIIIALETTCSW